jgi:hypothetical protein
LTALAGFFLGGPVPGLAAAAGRAGVFFLTAVFFSAGRAFEAGLVVLGFVVRRVDFFVERDFSISREEDLGAGPDFGTTLALAFRTGFCFFTFFFIPLPVWNINFAAFLGSYQLGGPA